MDKEHDWLSYYIYVDGNLYDHASDLVVLDVIAPLVRAWKDRGLISTFFFVRYSDDYGPHVRFRVEGGEETDPAKIGHDLRKQIGTGLPVRLGARSSENSEAAILDEPTLVRQVPYERETRRYGGPIGVCLAEEFFHLSSRIAIKEIRDLQDGERAARLGKGLLAMVVLLDTFLPSRGLYPALLEPYEDDFLFRVADPEHRGLMRQAFESGLKRQKESLTKYIHATWARLESGAPLTDTLDEYLEGLRDIYERFISFSEEEKLRRDEPFDGHFHAIQSIIPSYMHMMNNRLGIPVQEEAYLSHLIRNAASRAKQETN